MTQHGRFRRFVIWLLRKLGRRRLRKTRLHFRLFIEGQEVPVVCAEVKKGPEVP